MSNLSDALPAAEKAGAAIVETLIMAAIMDGVAAVPAPYQGIVQGIEAALQPIIKQFLDAQISKLGS